VHDALEFAEKLLATNPLFARINPMVAERLKATKSQNPHYLAHEYFNQDWHPMHFSTMVDCLTEAKVQYACSATYHDHIDVLNVTSEQLELLNSVQDPIFREGVRDFMVNQQFRRDYWVKGRRKLSQFDQAEQLQKHRVILTSPRANVSLKVTAHIGEASLNADVYNAILDVLVQYRPITIAEVEAAVAPKGVASSQVLQALMVLTGAGHVASVQDDMVAQQARPRTDRINAHIISQARGSGEIAYLASPLTGGGLAVGRFSQLFLLARSTGLQRPSEWAQFVWQIIAPQGLRMLQDGKAVDTLEANVQELTRLAECFASDELPLLQAMQIAS
jgi:hypothetical protein